MIINPKKRVNKNLLKVVFWIITWYILWLISFCLIQWVMQQNCVIDAAAAHKTRRDAQYCGVGTTRLSATILSYKWISLEKN